MAQRKPPSRSSTGGKSAKPRTGSAASGKSSAKASSKPTTSKPPTKTGRSSTARPTPATAARPVKRKPGKSIVNQKQRPWGVIATAVVLVLVAAGIIAYAVTRNSGSSDSNKVIVSRGGQPVDTTGKDAYRRPELPAAKQIQGVTYRVEGQHTHYPNNIKYDASPPIGGDHNPYWADCSGTVYTHQIANENAVHMLEHGAIWITYNPNTATKEDIAELTKDVQGVNFMAMSPYAGLKTPISIQAWGYQLFVQKASDPRIQQFIQTLKLNKETTPEYGASCSDPQFLQNQDQSTLGHPLTLNSSGV